MGVLFANSAKSKLAANLSSGATLLAIDEDDAWKFPSPTGGDWFPLTLFDAAGNIEYVKCTGRAAAILTIVRAQEGTTAKTFLAGSGVSHRLTAAALQAMRDTQSTALDTAVSNLEDSISGAVSTLTSRIDSVVGTPPNDLNSLQKIAEAIGDDADFATTMAAQIADAARLTTGMLYDERLPVRLWPYGENNVPSNADFAAKTGGYMCNPDTVNTPSPDWWYLRVEASSGGDVGQRFTRHSDGAEWTRRFVSGAWTTPKRVYETAEEILSVIDARFKPYTSPPITVTAGGTFTLTHALGSVPSSITAYAICTSADQGYSVGDRIYNLEGSRFSYINTPSAGFGISLVATDTSIVGRFGSYAPLSALNKANGVSVALNNASWELRVRAEK